MTYDCDMCQDTGSYRSFKVADGASGGTGRFIVCTHEAAT